jgi:hypothetical protein
MSGTRFVRLAAGAAIAASFAGTVLAFPIATTGEGLKVIVGGTDHVIATYQGNSAAFSNDLYLVLPGGDQFIFNNHASAVGSTVDLGAFSIGTELLFRLHVNNTGNDFFTGPAARNPDGHAHAMVQEEWQPGETLVSFEDLFNGPFVFNDLSFSFTNTVTTPPPLPGVPEPHVLAILGIGMLGLSALRARRRR